MHELLATTDLRAFVLRLIDELADFRWSDFEQGGDADGSGGWAIREDTEALKRHAERLFVARRHA